MAVKVVRGSVTTSALNYKLANAQTIAKGDLIRITTDGTIAIASGTSDTTGAVHGIALKNGAASGTTSDETKVAGDLFPVALFNSDTVIAIPLPSGVDENDFTVVRGETYTITATTQANAITETTNKGIATVVGFPSDDQSFDPDQGASVDAGNVYVSFAQAILDGRDAP